MGYDEKPRGFGSSSILFQGLYGGRAA